ncbi:comG operon protein 6 (ComGF) [Listeria floridensis FSL S10-1187]|uniref:ComG operon protein 6 (ComGF) n=1 Tax=Listeria floridensis FSL S10-1187 TaxID=1265817 RepID=A0ABN0RF10_9LIST|nr:comG operon protein 6 (ComGF) [Listeria floridensis FSL S10-1187]
MAHPKKIKHAFLPASNGFTLIEALLSLFTVASVLTLAPLVLQAENRIISASHIKASSEWHIFLKQLHEERSGQQLSKILPHGFCFIATDMDKETCYSQYKSIVRKQVDGHGHETVLTDIEDFQILSRSKFIEVAVSFNDHHFLQTKMPL